MYSIILKRGNWLLQFLKKDVQKPFKKRKEIEEEIEEVIASTVLMPSKIKSGRAPPKVSSSSVSSDAPLIKKKSWLKMWEISLLIVFL